jgi:hypothetical protein
VLTTGAEYGSENLQTLVSIFRTPAGQVVTWHPFTSGLVVKHCPFEDAVQLPPVNPAATVSVRLQPPKNPKYPVHCICHCKGRSKRR